MWAITNRYIFFPNIPARKLSSLKHPSIGQLFLTQFCMILVKPTSKMKIPEKLCGINQDQVDRLRLLTSSNSSKVTSLKITSTPSRPTTMVLNPFHATDLFWYPLKISENQRFSDVFRGYQKTSVAWNELTVLITWKIVCEM